MSDDEKDDSFLNLEAKKFKLPSLSEFTGKEADTTKSIFQVGLFILIASFIFAINPFTTKNYKQYLFVLIISAIIIFT